MIGMESILPLKTKAGWRKQCNLRVPIFPVSPWGNVFSSSLLLCLPRGAPRVVLLNHNLLRKGI